jgi:hypothetical protein
LVFLIAHKREEVEVIPPRGGETNKIGPSPGRRKGTAQNFRALNSLSLWRSILKNQKKNALVFL